MGADREGGKHHVLARFASNLMHFVAWIEVKRQRTANPRNDASH